VAPELGGSVIVEGDVAFCVSGIDRNRQGCEEIGARQCILISQFRVPLNVPGNSQPFAMSAFTVEDLR
jgi:hypothetical protein